METHERKIRVYTTPDGRKPFDEWLDDLRDGRAVDIIQFRLSRLRAGNLGDVQPVGLGVSELRIHYGPGYRVYFGQSGPTLVILLCGGDKGSQAVDIQRAQRYWDEFRRRNESEHQL